MQLTKGQHKTLIAIGIYGAFQLVAAIALLIWEFYSISLGDRATITETVQAMYSIEQWPFWLAILSVVAIAMFLFGHFFAAPYETYEQDRSR